MKKLIIGFALGFALGAYWDDPKLSLYAQTQLEKSFQNTKNAIDGVVN